MTNKKPHALEEQLLAELTNVIQKIAEFEKERTTLERLITRTRRENMATQDVTRKNSISRILAEKKVMEILEEANKPVRANHLLNEAMSVDPDMKNATFRSYIHRLKLKGIIEPGTSRGYWKLAKKSSKN